MPDDEIPDATPRSQPILAGIQLGSAAPERLRAWYVSVFAPPHATEDAVGLGGTGLSIGLRREVASTAAEPARVIVNLQVDDCQAIEARLVAAEAVWVRELERLPCGTVIGTVLDPDGNYIQVIQAPPDQSE